MDINATASLDSDGDGFTNEAELAAGTFPGDPNSYPGSSSQSPPILEVAGLVVASLFAVLLVFWFYKRRRKERHVSISVAE